MFGIGKEIPDNFNGIVIFGQEKYFFDLNKNILRIFFNDTGIDSVRDFNERNLTTLKKEWISGVCPDGRRVMFKVSRFNYSAYPDKYSEYEIGFCLKEVFYFLKERMNPKLTYQEKKEKEKISDFPKFDIIRISGKIINSIYPQQVIVSTIEGSLKVADNFSAQPKNLFSTKVQLTKKIQAQFSIMNEINHQMPNDLTLDTRIEFSFSKTKAIKDFTDIHSAIKRFIDFMAKARNTKFSISLIRKAKGELVKFAEIRVYDHYKNYCNKDWHDVIRLDFLESQVSSAFTNLLNEKYSLCFLPIDNDDYGVITYSDIQNLTTAIELACELDAKWTNFKQVAKQPIKKGDKERIILDWCKKYISVIKKTQPQNKGWSKPFHYNLMLKDLIKFRDLRHEITHRATGILDNDIVNCYTALKSIYYYYVLDIDPKEHEKYRL